MASWLLLFYWYTELATTSALGFPCFQSVTFIMTETGLCHAHIPKPIQWTVLPLIALLHPMRFWSTIQGQRGIMNRTPTVSIPIDCLPQFILLSPTMVVSSVRCIGMTTQAWKSSTLRVHVSNDLTIYQYASRGDSNGYSSPLLS